MRGIAAYDIEAINGLSSLKSFAKDHAVFATS
jgi:hypothetical protein